MKSLMRRYTLLLPVAVLLATSAAFGQNRPATMTADEFRSAMDRLWEDHITWTRAYIVSAVAKLPDKDRVAARLLRNQKDIGDAIVPYYGGAAGTKLTSLLTDHIKIATEIVDAAMKKDAAAQETATARWMTNGNDIAVFLSSANAKYWPVDTLKHHMRDHLTLTANELTRHLSNDWDGSIAAYDELHGQILKLSAALSDGIIRQFPAKFKP